MVKIHLFYKNMQNENQKEENKIGKKILSGLIL